MNQASETPFDNIESSHEYVALLAEVIEETRRDVEAQIALAIAENSDRRKQALHAKSALKVVPPDKV